MMVKGDMPKANWQEVYTPTGVPHMWCCLLTQSFRVCCGRAREGGEYNSLFIEDRYVT
jgi:hypothetical protein